MWAYRVHVWRSPHPLTEAIRDNKDYVRVLLRSDYTSTTGWGGGPPKVYCFSVQD